MAGDWIKMRVDLRDDPAVFKMAEILGIDELHVVGCLFCFWSWADKHSVDGRVDDATPRLIDKVSMAPGFSAAMESVGWLEFDESGLQIPHFERHNGESAKERGLKNARQARWRAKKDADVDAKTSTHKSTTSSTREEKRREDIKEANASLRATKKCPATFIVTDDMQAWAATECPGVDVGIETATLRDHEFKTARKDWPGTWRNWMRKAFKDAQSRPTGRQSFAAQDQQRTEQRASELAPGVARRSTPNTILEDRNVIAIGNR